VTDDGELVRRARAVLDRNRRGVYTCPSVKLYPHQWLWDSCFTAIGIARFDPARAAEELRALFRGQWDNGMLPHMIFAEGSKDLGSRRIWQSSRHPDAPRAVATTCITQPPVVALAVARVADALGPDERRAFVDEGVDRIRRGGTSIDPRVEGDDDCRRHEVAQVVDPEEGHGASIWRGPENTAG